MLTTECEFTLPGGYVDRHGGVHTLGTMRLATALDEIEPFQHPRARANDAYVSVILLSRVVTRLGEISPVGPDVIESLFVSDFSYLQALYLRLNSCRSPFGDAECPNCGTRFTLHASAQNQPAGGNA
jgi:hypothetical protein